MLIMGEVSSSNMTHIITLLCLLSVVCSVQGGQLLSFTKESYPDPQVDPSACGRTSASWVCDPGRYLTQKQVAVLEANINGNGGQVSSAIIMVAILPQLIGSDGRPTSLNSDLKAFANYLQQYKWKKYGSSLLVLVYHRSKNSVWVQSDYSSVTPQCICQLTYESQQYFTATGFPTLLDIYTSKFREIASGAGSCSTPLDNVPWKVDAMGVCTWKTSILVTRIDPYAGAPGGGTKVRLIGHDLDLTSGGILVGTMNGLITSRSATVLKFITPALSNNQNINVPLPVYLMIGGVKYDTGRRFIYAKPTLKDIHPNITTIGGGLLLTVDGDHLNLINTAVMITTLTGKQTNLQIEYTTTCQLETDTYMYCPTPQLELETVRPLPSGLRRRRKRDLTNRNVISQQRHRAERAAGSSDDQSTTISDVTLAVRILADNKALQTSDNTDTMFPVTVHSNPILYPFEGQDQTVTFVSVWPKSERLMDIKGTGLLPVLEDHDVSVLIGDGKCVAKEKFANRLVCNPPVSEPNANGTHPLVQAYVGHLSFKIGYLEYQDTFWKYPPTRYAIIGLVAVIVIGIILYLYCTCKKRKPRKRKTAPMEPQHTQMGKQRKKGKKSPATRK